MKLMLTSFWTSDEQDSIITNWVGKDRKDIKVAYIENAYDMYNDEASLIEGRKILQNKGYDMEVVDLRNWQGKYNELKQKLSEKDVFWFCGGNPYDLRWKLKESGADTIITDLVKQGKVYIGASAGGVVSGPTLKYFDELDDPKVAKEIIWEGLGLTDIVLIPHTDNKEFGEGCVKAGEQLKAAGYKTQFITDAQAFIIDGDDKKVI